MTQNVSGTQGRRLCTGPVQTALGPEGWVTDQNAVGLPGLQRCVLISVVDLFPFPSLFLPGLLPPFSTTLCGRDSPNMALAGNSHGLLLIPRVVWGLEELLTQGPGHMLSAQGSGVCDHIAFLLFWFTFLPVTKRLQ